MPRVARQRTSMKLRIAVALATGFVVAAVGGVRHPLVAQNAVALNGIVSSQDEGKMEGVVVSARGEGMNFTVSVVSDKDGKYSFPHANLNPGKYNLKIRAVGYD